MGGTPDWALQRSRQSIWRHCLSCLLGGVTRVCGECTPGEYSVTIVEWARLDWHIFDSTDTSAWALDCK